MLFLEYGAETKWTISLVECLDVASQWLPLWLKAAKLWKDGWRDAQIRIEMNTSAPNKKQINIRSLAQSIKNKFAVQKKKNRSDTNQHVCAATMHACRPPDLYICLTVMALCRTLCQA